MLFSLLFISCEKITIDPEYPTTFYKLSNEKLFQMRASFALKNKYLVTSLNEFGFCDWGEDLLQAETPQKTDTLSESQIIEKIKNFVSENPFETGINNPDELKFSKILYSTGYEGKKFWHCFAPQKVDTIDVMNAEIAFHISNSEITICVGNWYLEIYIPLEFNIDLYAAKKHLIGKKVTHSTFGGEEYHVIISTNDIENSTASLKILPIVNADKIELHVGWEINIPGPVFYKIYVDVMTGTIIGQTPTIIS
jgi:hypothetical protein